MTRAWPMVPLMSKKARPTQNHARASRCVRLASGSLGSAAALDFAADFADFFSAASAAGFSLRSAFTFHRNGSFERSEVGGAAVGGVRNVAVAAANFQLHKISRIYARVTRRTEAAFGV